MVNAKIPFHHGETEFHHGKQQFTMVKWDIFFIREEGLAQYF
jgi:hypothetical protein